jgi:hypothetical protein
MRAVLISLLLIMALNVMDAFAGGKWEGTGFSADFTQTYSDDSGQAAESGRFFLDSAGMRTEMSSDGERMVSIIRFEENDMLMLMPEEKMVMTIPIMSQGEGEPARLEGKFAGACAEFNEREHLGDETINGRNTQKWRCERHREGDPDANQWYDTKLGVPIAVEDDAGSRFEITNIVEGAQPADLFQPPADYQGMSMQGMMQMDQ